MTIVIFFKHLISIYGCISVSQKEIMSLSVTIHPVQNTNKAGEFDPSSLEEKSSLDDTNMLCESE